MKYTVQEYTEALKIVHEFEGKLITLKFNESWCNQVGTVVVYNPHILCDESDSIGLRIATRPELVTCKHCIDRGTYYRIYACDFIKFDKPVTLDGVPTIEQFFKLRDGGK